MTFARTYAFGGNAGELYLFLATRVASNHRNKAIYGGHGGVPRLELRKHWEEIAALPDHKYREEARTMIKHYQSLLDEDVRWVEPDAKALAAMTTEQKGALLALPPSRSEGGTV